MEQNGSLIATETQAKNGNLDTFRYDLGGVGSIGSTELFFLLAD